MAFYNATKALTTSLVTLYQCPVAKAAVVHALCLSNKGLQNSTVQIDIYNHSSLTNHTLVKNRTVGVGETYVFDKPINLEEGDEIQVRAGKADTLDAFASVLVEESVDLVGTFNPRGTYEAGLDLKKLDVVTHEGTSYICLSAHTTTATFTPENFMQLAPGGVGVPAGGTIGQALIKNSADDYDTVWQTIITEMPDIAKPGITSPAHEETGVVLNPTIRATPYYSLYGKEQAAIHVQIATDAVFTSLIYDDATQVGTSWQPSTALGTLDDYYVRIRYQDVDGAYSVWSDVTHFTTADVYIDTPYLTSPGDGKTDSTLTPQLTASAFVCVNGIDTHQSTGWQISTASDFSSVAWESLADTSNKTSITIPQGALAPGIAYYLRVRYTGTTHGSSSWSAPVRIVTDEVTRPSIVSPENGALDTTLTPTLQTSAFGVGSSDSHESTDWQVASDIGFNTLVWQSLNDTTDLVATTPLGLETVTTYYVRARHRGAEFGASEWSPAISFTTADIYIDAPIITTPLEGAVNQSTLPTLTADAFTCVNGSDTHQSSDWQVASDSGFTSLKVNIKADSANKTSLTLSTTLTPGNTYYARVRYIGTSYGGSDWSMAVSFTVDEVVQPTITNPVDGATGTTVSPTLEGSAFSVGSSDTHTSSDWQIASDAGFSSIIWESLSDALHLTQITASGLSTRTSYYIRVRYYGDEFGASEWSTPVSFTTADIYTETPSITSPTDNAQHQRLTPSITGSAFNTVNGSDTHQSTDWQVSSTSNFSAILWESIGDLSNLTSVTVPGRNLAAGTTYYLRVRYTGADFGTSGWSSVITITTDEVVQPSITSPADGALGVALNATLSASSFAVGSSDTHLGSDWEVATDSLFANIVFSSYDDTSNLTSIALSGLGITTQYYARVRYAGQNFGDSEWSVPVSFTTADIYIEQPTITSPTSGATDIGETPTFTTDAFNGTDTHVSSSWYLYRTSDETLVWSSVGDTSNLESITLPAGVHDTSESYRLEALHTGTTYGDSTKGTTTYTTAASFFDWGPGDDYDAMVAAGNYDSTTDTGYMGLVTSADLTDGPTLASDIGLSAGVAFNDTAGWLKFYVGPAADCNKDAVAKVIFIAKKTIRNNLSWDAIYLAGAVYGTGDNGVASASTSATATQDAQVTYDGTTYKVRLLTGSATDPAAEAAGKQQVTDDAGGGSEWNDLLYRVHTAVPTTADAKIGMEGGSETTRHGGPQDGANWASYTNAELQVFYTAAGAGTFCWCQEQGFNTTRRVVRGYVSVADFYTFPAGDAYANLGWRPVLEIVQ